MEINSVLNKLYSLHHFGIKLGLENIRALLEKIGNPHKNLRAFHIAGSNGKGSTASFIASILTECGYKVGLYTSPHFVRFNERIRINGLMIEDKYIVDFVKSIDDEIDKNQLTFFEVTTALAFKYFYDSKVDYTVIETGLGGRLDASNVITPIASVITSISLEHTQHLGDTIEKIAFEKAGIIKPSTFVFTGRLNIEAEKVIKQKAKDLNCSYRTLENEIQEKGECISLKFNNRPFTIYKTPLIGHHQLLNAALSVITLNHSLNIEDGLVVMKGIKNIFQNSGIEGRYEIVSEHPRIILDSAHNPEGIQTFVTEFSKEYNTFDERYLIFGAMKDKSIGNMLSQLNPYFTKIYFTKINIERAAELNELISIGAQNGINAFPLDKPDDFIKEFNSKGGNKCLVILGSMYLLGEIKTKKILERT